MKKQFFKKTIDFIVLYQLLSYLLPLRSDKIFLPQVRMTNINRQL